MTKATHKMTAHSRSSGAHLKKTIGIATFGYRTFPTDFNLEDVFQQKLINEINSECPDFILIAPEKASSPDVLKYPPRHASGKIDNFTISQKGRLIGLNAIVTGSAVDVSEAFEEKGLLWFKDTHNFVRIQVEINTYDTATAAKLLDESIIYKIEMNSGNMDKIKNKNFKDLPDLDHVLRKMSQKVAEKICNEAAIQSWKSYVTSVSGNQITLSSGNKTGLQSGDVLEIYDSKNTIEGVENQRFYLPGEKIGEVKITRVYPYYATAILISGKDISVGDMALYK